MRAKLVIFNGINEQCCDIFDFLYKFLLNFVASKHKTHFVNMIRSLILVALGGGVGSALRFLISKIVQDNIVGFFPYPTMVVNILGCLLIGLFYGLSSRGNLGGDSARLLLTTGLCGGFTTFSTFSMQSVTLLQQGRYGAAALYILGTVLVCVLFAALGCYVGGKMK